MRLFKPDQKDKYHMTLVVLSIQINADLRRPSENWWPLESFSLSRGRRCQGSIKKLNSNSRNIKIRSRISMDLTERRCE